MKRSQVVSYITRWEDKGALYIVAHARYQRKRGKNPSEPYKGAFNPQEALIFALTELHTYQPMTGEDIPGSVAKMLEIAKFTNQKVIGVFNGIAVTANPKSSAETLVVKWQEEMEHRRKASHLNFDEYRQQVPQSRMQVQAAQAKVRDLMQQLEVLDFKNLEVIVNWFGELQEASEIIKNISVLPRMEIVQKFFMHGYLIYLNAENEFNEEDKEGFAWFLVGKALTSLINHGLVFPDYWRFARNWRNKFTAPPAATETEPVN